MKAFEVGKSYGWYRDLMVVRRTAHYVTMADGERLFRKKVRRAIGGCEYIACAAGDFIIFCRADQTKE